MTGVDRPSGAISSITSPASAQARKIGMAHRLGETALRCYETAFDAAQLRKEADRTGLLASDV